MSRASPDNEVVADHRSAPFEVTAEIQTLATTSLDDAIAQERHIVGAALIAEITV
jgi:hypothetical protein